MAKENNDRKYPDGSRPRPDLSAAKREEAKERQAYSDSLTVEQKLVALNNPRPASNQERCGGESKKVRGKLAALLAKKNAPIPVPGAPAPPEVNAAIVAENEKKHLKAKERRRKEKKGE